MPALENDLELKLDPAHLTSLLTARGERRKQQILANDANRRYERAAATAGPTSTAAKAAEQAKATATAAADAQQAAFDAAAAAAKTAHNATATAAETHLDLGRGVLVLRARPTVPAPGAPGPAVERKRLRMSDGDCATYVTSYTASCAATDEAQDLQRKINDYLAANLPVDGKEPPELTDLRAALAARVAAVQAEMAVQGVIIAKTLGAERVTYSLRIDIATGELVLGDRPAEATKTQSLTEEKE